MKVATHMSTVNIYLPKHATVMYDKDKLELGNQLTLLLYLLTELILTWGEYRSSFHYRNIRTPPVQSMIRD